MILIQVRDYLRAHGQAPLRDMALTFNMQPQALKSLLEHWINKGRVEKLPAGSACRGGCSACAPETVEIYRWID